MEDKLQTYLHIFHKNRKKHKRTVKVTTALSLCVAAAVSWQLRYMGIAQSDVPCCGLEEHSHGPECLGRGALICGLEECEDTLLCPREEHTHQDACYQVTTTLTCTQEVHIHTEECYELQDVLVCTEDHEHTQECYEQQPILACALPEHTHTEECYVQEQVLTCTQAEHTHGPECYGGGHIHTDDCYETVCICGQEEHTHDLLCYSDLDADTETYEDWEATLPGSLSGSWGQRLLQVARSQLGYTESSRNFQLAEDGVTEQGYTRYGDWYGNPYGDWNTMFVSFCLSYAGIPAEAVPRSGGAYAASAAAGNMGLLLDTDYTPAPGDLVYLWEDGSIRRSAIVTGTGHVMEDGQSVPGIGVIEGDRDHQVVETSYPVSQAAGYLSMERAYTRAVDKGIVEAPNRPTEPTEVTEPTEATEPTEVTEATEPTEVTEPMTEAEVLDALLRDQLEAFDCAARDCMRCRELGEDVAAKEFKLQMDQCYADLKNLYGQRYPDAQKGNFGAYLRANCPQGLSLYQTALEAYPHTVLETVTELSAPIIGQAQSDLLLDTMKVEVTITGSAAFPETYEKEVVLAPDAALLEELASTEALTEPQETVAEPTEPEPTEAATEPTESAPAEAATEPTELEPTEGMTEPAEPGPTEGATEAPEPEPIEPEPMEPVAENTEPEGGGDVDSRWGQVEIRLHPVAPDTAAAFTGYIQEHYGGVSSVTAINLGTFYQNRALDIADAQILLNITPNRNMAGVPQNPLCTLRENVRETDAYQLPPPARELPGEDVETAAPESCQVTVLQRLGGQVVPATTVTVPDEELGSFAFPVSLLKAGAANLQAAEIALLAVPVVPETDPKPVENPVYPDRWGMEIQGPNFYLRTDPYFVSKAQEGTAGFETPAATLGYVLRNYNVFTRDNAVLSHVVGSAAVGGNAYYRTNQGASGDSYIPIQNYAPTYIQGRLEVFDSYVETGVPGPGSQPEKGRQLNHWNDCERMPTYLGTINEDPNAQKKPPVPDWFDGAFDYNPQDHSGYVPTPYYFVEDYIRFAEFFGDTQDKIESVTGNKLPSADSEEGKNASILVDGYQWEKIPNGPLRLFVTMGHCYEVDNLDGVQVVLVPPDDSCFGGKVGTVERANHLATLPINTVIKCNQPGEVKMWAGSNAVTAYYVKNQTEVFDPQGGVEYVTLANVENYTNSSLFLFPEAETLRLSQFVGHIVAPRANVIQPNTGDSYGCVIAREVHINGDLHMLSYGGSDDSIVIPPDQYRFNKKIQEDDALRTPRPDEFFEFKLEEFRFEYLPYADGTDYSGKPEGKPAPVLRSLQTGDSGPKSWLGTNQGSEITFAGFDQLLASFQRLGESWDHNTLPEVKGYYLYRITETGPRAGTPDTYDCDPNVYYMEIYFDHDPANAYAGAKQYSLARPSIRSIRLLNAYDPDTGAKTYRQDGSIEFVNTMNKGYTGPELPATGGIGTLPYTVAGLAFTAAPALVWLRRKRRSRI